MRSPGPQNEVLRFAEHIYCVISRRLYYLHYYYYPYYYYYYDDDYDYDYDHLHSCGRYLGASDPMKACSAILDRLQAHTCALSHCLLLVAYVPYTY